MPAYRRGGGRRYVLALLVLSAITLVTLDSRSGDSGPLGFLGRAAHEVVSPVAEGVHAVTRPVGDWFDGLTSAGSLKKDNDRLRATLADMQSKVRRADAALQENRRYKELLDLPIPEGAEAVTANVILGPSGNYESTMTIDKGSHAGIALGMPVVAAEGLVGRVVDVWSGGAKVLLLTDAHSGVSVRMVRSRLIGEAGGRSGKETLVLDLVEPAASAATDATTTTTSTTVADGAAAGTASSTSTSMVPVGATSSTTSTTGPASGVFDVAVGDDAVTSGLEGSVYPPGFLVGEVMSVESDPGTTLHRVVLRPFVDFARLETVRVLRWTPPPATTGGG